MKELSFISQVCNEMSGQEADKNEAGRNASSERKDHAFPSQWGKEDQKKIYISILFIMAILMSTT